MATKEQLEDQLAKTRTDMKILASMATERGCELADDARSGLKDRADMLSGEAKAMMDEAAATGQRIANAAEDRIKSHPFAAAGIALAMGFVIGSMMRRR